MNYKAIALVYVLQLMVGVIWYSAAPADVALQLEDSLFSSGSANASIIGFCVALFLYTYFNAWLLAKANLRSSFTMLVLILLNWLFVVLPNLFFVSVFLDFAHVGIGYLLSFGFISSFIAACILPFWRASRTIFKG